MNIFNYIDKKQPDYWDKQAKQIADKVLEHKESDKPQKKEVK